MEKAVRKLIPSTNEVFDRYWSGDMVKGAFNTKTGLFSKQFWSKPQKVAKNQDPLCDQIVWDPKRKNM